MNSQDSTSTTAFLKRCSLLLIILFPFLVGCASNKIIRDSDYTDSLAAMRTGSPEKAMILFPSGEQKGFITSMEKSWISLWNGNKDQSSLLDQVKFLESRKYTSISREAEYFFFSESEEGYIPGEHEIIVLHLLSAMYFMENQQWDEAKVEARLAGYFLQTMFNPNQPHFDDPALRIWLASIWSALGEWNEAQVDLRRAYELSQNKNLLPLILLNHPPKNLALSFYGVSPHLDWVQGEAFPKFSNKTAEPLGGIHYSTEAWYQRHMLRNTAIRDIVSSSNYMAQYYGVKFGAGSEKALGYTAGGAIMTTGVILGTAIFAGGVYLLASAGVNDGQAIGYIIGAGFIVGAKMWKEGSRLASDTARRVDEEEEQKLENMRTYRFMRFLPNWIALEADPILITPWQAVKTYQAPKSKTSVQFIQRF
ncbi:hypothetical protein [Bdellovibrio sp. NC01]|uniref:hypothetical protein n=1 Tax=Bdellovibrio sp. NC01 TaxID=2220073 RepID=UPI001156DED4|nr:hypothetical protein [Bdellovibrio sp. NC01]QDK39260.1 hypothetical protein DOE51_17520 [Bdellovibrio sp. NC01]